MHEYFWIWEYSVGFLICCYKTIWTVHMFASPVIHVCCVLACLHRIRYSACIAVCSFSIPLSTNCMGAVFVTFKFRCCLQLWSYSGLLWGFCTILLWKIPDRLLRYVRGLCIYTFDWWKSLSLKFVMWIRNQLSLLRELTFFVISFSFIIFIASSHACFWVV